MNAPDCRTCGACCIGGFDDGEGFADCSAVDVRRLSRYAQSRLQGSNQTPAVMTDEFGKSCGFLRGTPRRRVSCGIYSTRPEVCRRFRPGGRSCRDARRELGL